MGCEGVVVVGGGLVRGRGILENLTTLPKCRRVVTISSECNVSGFSWLYRCAGGHDRGNVKKLLAPITPPTVYIHHLSLLA